MAECVGVECRNESDSLCDLCRQITDTYLAELGDLWATAHWLLPASRRPSDIKAAAMPTAKPPLDLDIFQLLDYAVEVVVGWATDVLEEKGLARPAWGSVTQNFYAALNTLRRHDDILRSSASAGDYHYSLFRVHRELRRAVRGESEGRMDGDCPSCGRRSMIHRNAHVACLTCGGSWVQGAYTVLQRNAHAG
jgi:hypothetical protein